MVFARLSLQTTRISVGRASVRYNASLHHPHRRCQSDRSRKPMRGRTRSRAAVGADYHLRELRKALTPTVRGFRGGSQVRRRLSARGSRILNQSVPLIRHACASQRPHRKWDREFESGLLQRGVTRELDPRVILRRITVHGDQTTARPARRPLPRRGRLHPPGSRRRRRPSLRNEITLRQ
jgi:hypothetical protein